MKSKNKKRLLSQIIDLTVVFIFILILFFGGSFLRDSFPSLGYGIKINLYLTLFMFIYYVFCYSLFNGVTLGRFIFKIRVVNSDLTHMKFNTILLRSLLQCMFPLILFNLIYQFIFHETESLFASATQTTIIDLI